MDAVRGEATEIDSLERERNVSPADLVIDVDEFESDDVERMHSQDDVLAAPPLMPTQLVAPVASAVAVRSDRAWGLKAVRALDSSFTGRGVTVAVLDTGIDAKHEAFSGMKLIQKDFTGSRNGDRNGHGTHCAATIFGRRVGRVRVGIAQGVQKGVVGKVLDAEGRGSTAHVFDAILWAHRQGAQVISLSLGIDFPGYVDRLVQEHGWPIRAATSRALEAYRSNVQTFGLLAALLHTSTPRPSCLLVGAAGNESQRDKHPRFEVHVSSPSVAEGFVSVAALGRGDHGFEIAPFSNAGASIAAPGVGILSAKAGGGLCVKSGTSMAAPHVAGVAALWAEKLLGAGAFNASQLSACLLGRAVTADLHPRTKRSSVGAGLVQAP